MQRRREAKLRFRAAFNGEDIQDIKGDILDKEYSWREELLKVNDAFLTLLGCRTGLLG
jgi:hypothetical protein